MLIDSLPSYGSVGSKRTYVKDKKVRYFVGELLWLARKRQITLWFLRGSWLDVKTLTRSDWMPLLVAALRTKRSFKVVFLAGSVSRAQ